MALAREVDERLHLNVIAHVGLQKVGRAAPRADVRGALLATGLAVGDDDAGAAQGAEFGRGRADALGPAGDEDDVSLQPCAHGPSCPVSQRAGGGSAMRQG